MRTLVTGGAGFIGSHVVTRLLSDGHDVVVIDNLSTGRLQNLAHVAANPRLAVHQADVVELDAIRPLFARIDWVFHLAALADIVPSVSNPGAYYRSNVTGTFSVLEAARHASVRRFLYAASASCYGVPDDDGPTRETADFRPQYPYALTKHLG
jgi:UDP-glucose 4-epimerase